MRQLGVRMSPEERDEVVREVKVDVADHLGEVASRGACFHWALATVRALAKRGVRVCLQAGTMEWPCAAEDDGVSPTHFGYVWDPTAVSEVGVGVVDGMLVVSMPEIHVWAGLPDTGEAVDLSTAYFKEQARRHGVPWTGPDPPDYVWATASELPDGVLRVRREGDHVGAAAGPGDRRQPA